MAEVGQAEGRLAPVEPTAVDDIILPFQIHPEGPGNSVFHGRLVRFGPLIDEIVRQHRHPDPIARLVGECCVLTVALAGGLKYDGIFTLQIQSDGPVSLVVTDVTTAGELRSYAKYDEAKIPGPEDAPGTHVPTLLGRGHLAFTVDQGPDTDRYQGLVELAGETIAECATHYFRQSAQLDAAVMLAADRTGPRREDSEIGWRAGGLVLQHLADGEPASLGSADGDDPWRRAMILMATGTEAEILDPALPARRFVHRLFHEEGLEISAPRRLTRGCRCSPSRIVSVLRGLPRSEVEKLAIGGQIEVTCEFCNREFVLDLDQLGPE
jgi:molecular chaperone Hsp33